MRRTQAQAIERLEKESIRSIDAITALGAESLARMWQTTRSWLKDAVEEEYRRDFARSTWNVTDAIRCGTIHRIDQSVAQALSDFRDASVSFASRTFKEVYKESVLRSVWILDQVTPPKVDARLPQSRMFAEAAGPVYLGPDEDTTWKVRWSAWMDAYRQSLNNNLKLGAINESTIDDAIDEVDATRPGSPQADLWTAIERIYDHQAVAVSANAQRDVANANQGIGVIEIWQTRYYDRVCDICDANKGLTREEADDVIPAHPNCGCYWRLVPKDWADLLKSGDAEDRELAKTMDAFGEVPSAMLIYNDAGALVGSTIVEFEDWAAEKIRAVSGR